MDVVDIALDFATEAHRGQLRKYTGEPYITHPREVAMLVSSVPHTKDMLCAALLHDTVEDTYVTLLDIEKKFGPNVRHLVEMLTDVSKPSDGNRAIRKSLDLAHTASASKEAKTIKLADLISNSSSIVERAPDFAKVYMEEKKALLEVLQEGDSTLFEKAKEIVDNYFNKDEV